MLNPKAMYVTIDESGFIVRLFNTAARNISSYKDYIVAIPYKVGNDFEF